PLVREHPTIPEYRQELGNSYGNLGSVLQERKASAEGEQAFRAALEQDEALLAQFPEDPEDLLRKGAGEGNVALALSAQGKKKEALGWFGRSLEHLKAARARMKRPPAARPGVAGEHHPGAGRHLPGAGPLRRRPGRLGGGGEAGLARAAGGL